MSSRVAGKGKCQMVKAIPRHSKITSHRNGVALNGEIRNGLSKGHSHHAEREGWEAEIPVELAAAEDVAETRDAELGLRFRRWKSGEMNGSSVAELIVGHAEL